MVLIVRKVSKTQLILSVEESFGGIKTQARVVNPNEGSEEAEWLAGLRIVT